MNMLVFLNQEGKKTTKKLLMIHNVMLRKSQVTLQGISENNVDVLLDTIQKKKKCSNWF